MKEKNKIKSPWRLYMSGEVGQKGYYISTIGDRFYGPFKSKKIAEFFNLLAFGNPRDPGVKNNVSKTICEFNSIVDGNHPSDLIASNSKFALWWQATFGQPFTSELALKLARETGAQGYDSFREWLLKGSKISGKHVMAYDE